VAPPFGRLSTESNRPTVRPAPRLPPQRRGYVLSCRRGLDRIHASSWSLLIRFGWLGARSSDALAGIAGRGTFPTFPVAK
jgi:hypothetical protein